jgi:RNA polymerase sigma factor (sigma-70 family)
VADGPAKSDSELACRAQTGDRQAFDLLVRRHKGPLFRLIRRHIGAEEEGRDVLQETFVSAWLAIRRYDANRSFVVWLRAIALNKCRDFGRRQSVRRRFLRFFAAQDSESSTVAEATLTGDDDVVEAERLQRLDRAIAALPHFYKEPLLLTLIGGLSHREAAEQLKTTAKAIEMRIRRARKKLAEAFPEDEG